MRVSERENDKNISSQPPTPENSHIHFEKEVDDEDDEYDEDDEGAFQSPDLSEDSVDPDNPNSYSWTLMNLGVVMIVQRVLRSTITLTGMEILGTNHTLNHTLNQEDV